MNISALNFRLTLQSWFPIAFIVLCSLLVGCPARQDGPTAGEEAASDVPPRPQPEDAKVLHEPIPMDGAPIGKASELTREERIKQEVLTEYTGEMDAQNAGGAMVNPANNKLCWPALYCTYSQCPGKDKDGKPKLFAYRYPAVKVGSDGKPDWSDNASAPALQMMGVCPYCLKVNTVEQYIPPDARASYDEVGKRIEQKRREFAEITKGGGMMTGEKFNEMKQLIQQRAALPVHYLSE